MVQKRRFSAFFKSYPRFILLYILLDKTRIWLLKDILREYKPSVRSVRPSVRSVRRHPSVSAFYPNPLLVCTHSKNVLQFFGLVTTTMYRYPLSNHIKGPKLHFLCFDRYRRGKICTLPIFFLYDRCTYSKASMPVDKLSCMLYSLVCQQSCLNADKQIKVVK
jgi:hypothetical protein